MNDEKQLTEYKEPKGIFNWLKYKFKKLKERFSGKKENTTSNSFDEGELSEEELDEVKGGVPIPTKVVEEEKVLEYLGVKESKSWELTKTEQEEANTRESVETPNLDEGELTEEELDEVKGGQPIIEDER